MQGLTGAVINNPGASKAALVAMLKRILLSADSKRHGEAVIAAVRPLIHPLSSTEPAPKDGGPLRSPMSVSTPHKHGLMGRLLELLEMLRSIRYNSCNARLVGRRCHVVYTSTFTTCNVVGP